MRDTKFRTRLFLCFLAVIVMTLVLPGLYVRKNIKEDGIEETVRNARREAVLIRMQMETAPDGVHGLSSTFDRIGTELGIRITFIGADGTVLAESDSSRINLNDLDNHADRQEIGAAIRATGFNPQMIRAQGIDTNVMLLLGLFLSNALTAMAGAFIGMNNGFFDVGMGVGTIVIGLASVIIGEVLFGTRSFKNSLVSVILGSIVYRFVIAIVLQMGMPPNDLKLFTSVLVVIALALPMMRDKVQRRKVG